MYFSGPSDGSPKWKIGFRVMIDLLPSKRARAKNGSRGLKPGHVITFVVRY